MNGISQSLRVLLWSCVFIYAVFCSLQITQVDIWWQLSDGFHLLRTFHLPTAPIAAFGLPARPYFDEYAGYEVVLACVFKLAGFPGLWMLFSAIYLTILFLPSRYARGTDSRYDVLSCLALLTAALILKDRMEQRPELVGSLLQMLLLLALRQTKLEAVSWRSAIPFFILFLVWTNTHSSFLLGFFTLFLWLGSEVFLKYKSVSASLLLRNGLRVAGMSFVALIVNPYGFERLGFPFVQALDPGSTALSSEMWPIMNIESVTGIMVLVAVFLIAWAAVTSRTTPLWLILYSLFAAVMTFKSFRCVSLLAIALLFVYADRDAQMKPGRPRHLLLALPGGALICFACLFMLFGDAYTFDSALDEMRHETHFATHTNCYAPEIVDPENFGSDQRLPVLCGLAEGSYLSFENNQSFRPILDSGMSHFADPAKRYFFFIDHDPEALQIALKDLKVNFVMVNNRTFPWLLEMGHDPDWKMIACTPNGILWKRLPDWQQYPGGSYLRPASGRDAIAAARDTLLRNGDVQGAFCYSTLLGQPAESLTILSHFVGTDWSDAFFNYFRGWVKALPPPVIQAFLSRPGAGDNVLMDAILSERLGPDQYAQYAKSHSPAPQPWLWKAVQIEDALARGDQPQARKIFATISTNQPSSVAYYRLWHEIRAGNPGETDSLGSYGEWQTWDEGARIFMESVSTQLNARIDHLGR